MAKISVVLFKSKILKNGEHPIMLRVTVGNKMKHFSMDMSTNPKQWDEKEARFIADKRINPDLVSEVINEDGSIKKHIISYKSKNAVLNTRLVLADEILKRFTDSKTDWTFSMFADEFAKKLTRNNFAEYVDTRIKYYKENKRTKYGISFQELKHKISLYDKKLDARYIQDIDRSWVQGFIDYCTKQSNKPNTISIYLRGLRVLLNDAISEGIGSKESYPFSDKYGSTGGIKISDYRTETRKRYIPVDYLTKLKNKKFDNLRLERAKHLFLFSFYCYGINWTDMAKLTKKNQDQTVTEAGHIKDILIYKRSKTKKSYSIAITPEILSELTWFRVNTLLYKDYLLPIITEDVVNDKLVEHIKSKRRRFSEALKDIANELEFPPAFADLSSYFARHSFAMALRQKGLNIDVIQTALGHSSPTTTKTYLASFDNDFMEEQTSGLI